MSLSALFMYLLPLAMILGFYAYRHKQKERRALSRLESSKTTGLMEPPSLHPVINPSECIGCGSCVLACPETSLGIVGGKGVLVAPAHCIGHGACQAACPVDAIQLVFGTEKRGMEIPMVSPTFETNVPGIFIAGELGGMGLIRKGIEQGKQAIDSIRKKKGSPSELDVVIVGAGPAGLAASLAAKQHKLRFVTIEQEDSIGGSVYHYPRNKIAMTAPMDLPIVGKVNMYEISKEELLGFWNRVIREQQLDIHFKERMESITPVDGSFLIKTSQGTYTTKNVLLAIGRRGTPRKLDAPGEEQAKVVYRLIDPEQYHGQKVLVVGGGDSAIEAALALAQEPGTTVTLSYRGEAFGRIKEKNRQRLHEAESNGQLSVLLQSNVTSIGQDSVILNTKSVAQLELSNDAVIVCAGGILPTPALKEMGVMVETHFGALVN
jgi:thioredoxin reductase